MEGRVEVGWVYEVGWDGWWWGNDGPLLLDGADAGRLAVVLDVAASAELGGMHREHAPPPELLRLNRSAA